MPESSRGWPSSSRWVCVQAKVINCCLCSLLAGFAGAADMARFPTSQSQWDMSMEFEAITAVAIGGTLLIGVKAAWSAQC